MSVNQISRDDVVAGSTSFVDAPEVVAQVSVNELQAGITLEIEGRINVQGGGGGRIQFTGPAGAQIQGHADVDNGAPAFFSGFGTPIGGAIGNGNHKFRVWAVVQTGDNQGPIQLQIALNSQPGAAQLTLGRTSIRAERENASF